jgi:hypothetical protein
MVGAVADGMATGHYRMIVSEDLVVRGQFTMARRARPPRELHPRSSARGNADERMTRMTRIVPFAAMARRGGTMND